MSPERIQLRRTKGWRKPAGAVVVARPSKWGNQWRVVKGMGGTWRVRNDWLVFTGLLSEAEAIDVAVEKFKSGVYHMLRFGPGGAGAPRFTADDLSTLAGRDLACWCPLDQPCHADVLLELANATEAPDA